MGKILGVPRQFKYDHPEIIGTAILNSNIIEEVFAKLSSEKHAFNKEAALEVLLDLLMDHLDNDAEVVEEYLGYHQGDGDEFCINICEWSGIFFVQANEFDDIGYFTNIAAARFFAKDIADNYPPI